MGKVLEILRNWTLPVAIAGGAVVYYLFALIPAFDGLLEIMLDVLMEEPSLKMHSNTMMVK